MPLAGGQGGLYPTRNLGVQLTLFQPGWADYAHHITACPPRFEKLTASLHCIGCRNWGQGAGEAIFPSELKRLNNPIPTRRRRGRLCPGELVFPQQCQSAVMNMNAVSQLILLAFLQHLIQYTFSQPQIHFCHK